jgi:hypothetical protein
MNTFLKLAEKAGFKVKDGEVMDGDDYHIQTDLLEKFYDLVRKKKWVELNEREKYAIASFHFFNESAFQAVYEDISAKLKDKNYG